MKIYTIGYANRTIATLKTIVERLDAHLFDVRYSPASRMPEWSGARLRAVFGDRYTHLRELGNANYKNDGPIQLVDYVTGKRKLLDITNTRSLILMCVCGNAYTCHRSYIASKLRHDGFDVEEFTRFPVAPAILPAKENDGQSLFDA